MKISALFLAACIPLAAFAQTPQVPQSTLDELSADLSGLHQTVLQAQERQRLASSIQLFDFSDMRVTVTKDVAQVRSGASVDAEAIFKATQGQSFKVIDKANDWYAVAIEKHGSTPTAGWINAADSTPVVLVPSGKKVSAGVTKPNDIFDDFLSQVSKMKEKYKNNSYLSVTGFSINVGVPPSLSVNIEFKK